MTEDEMRNDFKDWLKSRKLTNTGAEFRIYSWIAFKSATELAEKRHAEEIDKLKNQLSEMTNNFNCLSEIARLEKSSLESKIK